MIGWGQRSVCDLGDVVAKSYYLFISHSWAQRGLYRTLIDWFVDYSHFSIIDLSVPRERQLPGGEKEIEKQISGEIAKADVFLVVNKPAVSHGVWLNFEVNEAWRLGVPVLSILPQKTKNPRTCTLVNDLADAEAN